MAFLRVLRESLFSIKFGTLVGLSVVPLAQAPHFVVYVSAHK